MFPLRVFQLPGQVRLPTWIAVVAAAGAVLLLAACGAGGDGEGVAATPVATEIAVVSTPTPVPTATPAPTTVHTVKAGDTAWAIATEFGITLAALAAANAMTEAELERLQIGQELQIPRPSPDS